MKKLYPALGAVLAALLLTACQMPGALGVGSLKISVPAPSALRGATTSGHGDQIRIQLVRNGVVVPLGGQATLQQGLAGQTITVDGLATGTNYKIYASSGTVNTNGFFETSYFATSDPFEISAGTSTSVSVTLNTTPISIIEGRGTSVNHAAAVGGTQLQFIVGPDIVYTINSDPAASTTTFNPSITSYLGASNANAATAKVYSMTNTPYGLWVNTNQGIFVSSGSTLQSATAHPMLASPTVTGNLNPVPQVYNSGTVSLSGGVLAYFYGPGLSAGLAPDSTAAGPNFNNGDPMWTTLTDLLGLSQGSTLQTALSKLSQAVYGVATDKNNYAYISTGIGTYRLDAYMLTNGLTNLGSDLTNGTDGQGNSSLLATEDGALIGPVSTYSDGTTAWTFAGTGKGLYASNVNPANGIPIGDGKLSVISGTEGLNIANLATTSANGSTYTAAYSTTTGELLLFNGLSLTTRVPTLAGLPSGTLQLTWYEYTSLSNDYLVIVIAGSDATVEYPVTSWAAPPS